MSTLKIENMSQLRLEIRRLEALKSHQEDLIAEDVREVKKSLHPKKLLNSFFKTFTSPGADTPDLLRNGISFGINFLSDSLLYRKSPGLLKYLLTQLIQNSAANAVAGKPDSIVDKIKSAIGFILFKRKNARNNSVQDDLFYDESEPYGV